MRDKEVRLKQFTNANSLPADFDKPTFDATIRDKGYDVIYEKAYRCPCKGEGIDALSTCQNCRGGGWYWANPIQTKMILTGITSDKRYEEHARLDVGMVQVTALETDKLSRMDRVQILRATSEHTEVKYAKLKDDDTANFFYTKYSILYIDNLAMYESATQVHTRLVLGDDYTFYDNIVTLDPKYNDREDISLSIRYGHNPMVYIWDIARDSMESYVTKGDRQELIHLPVHAVAKRAHLVKDAENYLGNYVLDNSWLPACDDPTENAFARKLKYTPVETLVSLMTTKQKTDIQALVCPIP